jgi:hypothetical protein
MISEALVAHNAFDSAAAGGGGNAANCFTCLRCRSLEYFAFIFIETFFLSACGWAAGWGTDKAANWLCRQMIATKCGKCRKSWRGNISKRRTVAVHPQPSWGRPLRALTLC